MATTDSSDLLTLLEELQTIARNGLAFCENPYDRDRYEQLLEIACRTYAPIVGIPSDTVRRRLTSELGYITPKVGASAAIFDEEGRIFLLRRSDDGTWCLPGGWLDPNESPAEAAAREAREEAGLEVRPYRLVDVFTRRANAGHGPHSAVGVVYLCEITGGAPELSHEAVEHRWWTIDDVPAWHELHEEYARGAERFWRQGE